MNTLILKSYRLQPMQRASAPLRARHQIDT